MTRHNPWLIWVKPIIIFLLTIQINPVVGQIDGSGVWSDVPKSSVRTSHKKKYLPSRYRTLKVNLPVLRRVLAKAISEEEVSIREASAIISLPLPDGSFARFRFAESSVMAPELAAQYPDINSYAGQGLDQSSVSTRFDMSPAGFRAVIDSPEGTVYIDPCGSGDSLHYISYYKHNLPGSKRIFEVPTKKN
jgi:hypothetical protein